jgi:hypothetical protein
MLTTVCICRILASASHSSSQSATFLEHLICFVFHRQRLSRAQAPVQEGISFILNLGSDPKPTSHHNDQPRQARLLKGSSMNGRNPDESKNSKPFHESGSIGIMRCWFGNASGIRLNQVMPLGYDPSKTKQNEPQLEACPPPPSWWFAC